eukprot:EG_transcript_21416
MRATLLRLGMPAVDPPPAVTALLREALGTLTTCTPALIRRLCRPSPSFTLRPDSVPEAVLLLTYCVSDFAVPNPEKLYNELHGLPLLPLADGNFGAFGPPEDPPLWLATEEERQLLQGAHAARLVDSTALSPALLKLLQYPSLQGHTNVRSLTASALAALLLAAVPQPWRQQPTTPIPAADLHIAPAGMFTQDWVRRLWQYAAARRLAARAFLGLPVLWTVDGGLATLLARSRRPVVDAEHWPLPVRRCAAAWGCLELDHSTVPPTAIGLTDFVCASTPAGLIDALGQCCGGAPDAVAALFADVDSEA